MFKCGLLFGYYGNIVLSNYIILIKGSENTDKLCSKLNSNLEPDYKSESNKDPENGRDKVKNSKLITIKPNPKVGWKCKLDLTDLKVTYDSPLYNMLEDKETILKDYRHKTGIYLIHNNVNGKQYVGNAVDLGNRLVNYYYPSRLGDKRYISNSILKYGHDNFSIVILCVLGDTGTCTKDDLIRKEQEYIDLCKPILNLNPVAGSSMGFKHSEESKRLISEYRTGKSLSTDTKKKLSSLFSGESNPFWHKTHSLTTLEKMSVSKLGSLNPMFKKEKSKEFIAQMFRDKRGPNNPMYGKHKSEQTLAKLRKKVYVYDNNEQFICCYEGVVLAIKDLHMSSTTLKKYMDTGKPFKGKYFYSKLQ